MAILKNTTVNDTGFLQLPAGTTAQRPSPLAGQMRFNTTTSKAEFYNATTAAWLGTPAAGTIATGGTVYDVDVEGTTYRVHVFTNAGNSTFTVTKGGEVEYLVVAGGGKGGQDLGGGGGAGGVLTGFFNTTAQAYAITVGGGGTTGTNVGQSGSNSSTFNLTAIGGGGGGGCSSPAGATGGSGGGASGTSSTFCQPSTTQLGGTGTEGQGFRGGNRENTHTNRGGGGGGGATQIGQGPRSSTRGGGGGGGLRSAISGISVFYSGGGGGGGSNSDGLERGGIGGGGIGAQASFAAGGQGTPNTGSGGGGGGSAGAGGVGGSGIVVIRYPLRQENPVSAANRLVTNNLILNLDSAFYPGRENTFFNNGSVSYSATINGTALTANIRTHRSAIITPQSQTETWVRMPELALQALPNGTVWTLEWGMTVLSHSGTRYCQSMAITGNDNVMIWQINATTMSLYPISPQSGSDPTYTIGTPIMLTLTRNGNTWRAYKNGVFSAQYSFAGESQNIVEGWVLDQEQDAVLGGFDPSQNTNAEWFYNRLYSTVLTDAEILQNFNVTRWRFGI